MQDDDFQAHSRLDTSHWWFVARLEIVRMLLHQVLPPSRDLKIVDIGCGTGGAVAGLAGDYAVSGIDPSATAIGFARARFPELDLRCGEPCEILLGSKERVNAVLIMDVLEHVKNDAALLACAVEALAPGGYVVLTVPADMRLWSSHDERFGHFRRYDMRTLQSLWEALPIRLRMLSYFNTRLYPAIRTFRAAKRLLGISGEASDLAATGPWLNRVLLSVFRGESQRLVRALENPAAAYRFGVSLIAVLEKAGNGSVGQRASDAVAVADREQVEKGPDHRARRELGT